MHDGANSVQHPPEGISVVDRPLDVARAGVAEPLRASVDLRLERVDHHHGPALAHQAVHQMGADESGSSRDQDRIVPQVDTSRNGACCPSVRGFR